MRPLAAGGPAGLGLEVARHRAALGDQVVITGTEASRTAAVATSLGSGVDGIPLDLSRPHTIGAALAEVGDVDRLVLAAIERDTNSGAAYRIHNTLRAAN